MAKEEKVQFDGEVIEALPNLMFKVGARERSRAPRPRRRQDPPAPHPRRPRRQGPRRGLPLRPQPRTARPTATGRHRPLGEPADPASSPERRGGMIKLASLAALFVALIAATAVAVAATDIGRPTSFQAGFTATHRGASSGSTSSSPARRRPRAPRSPPPCARSCSSRAARASTPGRPGLPRHRRRPSAQGAEAVCPPGSRIGNGRGRGRAQRRSRSTSTSSPSTSPRRIDFAAESNGMPLKQGFFGRISGRRLMLDVPTSNGAIAPTRFEAHIRGPPARAAGATCALRAPARAAGAGASSPRSPE